MTRSEQACTADTPQKPICKKLRFAARKKGLHCCSPSEKADRDLPWFNASLFRPCIFIILYNVLQIPLFFCYHTAIDLGPVLRGISVAGCTANQHVQPSEYTNLMHSQARTGRLRSRPSSTACSGSSQAAFFTFAFGERAAAACLMTSSSSPSSTAFSTALMTAGSSLSLATSMAVFPFASSSTAAP